MIPTAEDYHRRLPDTSRQSGGVRRRREAASGQEDLTSVITVGLNCLSTVDRTIDSVRGQTHQNIEYIVVDGGSTDGTVQRLKAREADIDCWISEPDAGISDAFNKGIELAHGRYVAMLNADDWWEPEFIERAVVELSNSDTDFVFGDLVFHQRDGSVAHRMAGDPLYARRLQHSLPSINHPTVVCRRELYLRAGLFDTSLAVAMDYEWFLRIHRFGAIGIYSPQLLGHMRLGGRSDHQFKKGLAEVRDVSIRYGYPKPSAWSRYLFRVFSVRMRLFLGSILSASAVGWLRSKINSHYQRA